MSAEKEVQGPGRYERSRRVRYTAAFAALGILLIILFVLNVNAGSVPMSAGEIFQIVFTRQGDPTNVSIVWQIRLPRILAAMLLGGALSVSGFLLQTFFHNPIAGPFVLGISSGAKLVVALVMVFLLSKGVTVSSTGMVLAAFAGSMLSMGFVLAVEGKVKSMSMLVVAGVMIGYICSAVTDFVVTFAEDTNIVNLHNWSLGSFSGTTWDNVYAIAVICSSTVTVVFLMSKPMGAFLLGENYARNLGVNIRLFRVLLVLLSSILSATVTAFAGPISFVGVAVPHMMKSILNTSKPILVIPACALGGAVFCLVCDLIARTLFAPTELSISSVTAIFGAPVVIFIMVRQKKGE